MGTSSSQFKLSRTFFLGVCAALVVGAACGGNPELTSSGQSTFNDGRGLNESCSETETCAPPLLCGPSSVCVEACSGVTDASCRDEVCMPDGLCSVGLGRDCNDDSDCKSGLHCSSSFKHCSVPCQPGANGVCKDGSACREDATCRTPQDLDLGMGGGANGSGGEPNGAAGAPGCIDLDVDFTEQIPTVLLLIDRSGSMTAGDGFGAAVKSAVDGGTYELGSCPDVRQNNRNVNPNDWRWNVVRDVLMNPDKGIVKPLEARVRFGLSLYSSNNGRIKPAAGGGVEIDPNKKCPVLIQVPIGLNNHQAMLDQFKCSDLAGDTPTRESLLVAADELKSFTEPGPKVIVLATDGEPDSCDCPNFEPQVPASQLLMECRGDTAADDERAAVVDAAQQIHGDDITIHVINVSTPSLAALQKHLTDVANAGGGNVYPGFSPGALSDAFEDIINGVRSCVIDLDGEIAPGKDSDGTITLDGQELGLDDPDGWQVNSPSQIELLGEACEAIKKGGHDIAIKFPCDSFKPPVH